jgi:hypothetical protein
MHVHPNDLQILTVKTAFTAFSESLSEKKGLSCTDRD